MKATPSICSSELPKRSTGALKSALSPFAASNSKRREIPEFPLGATPQQIPGNICPYHCSSVNRSNLEGGLGGGTKSNRATRYKTLRISQFARPDLSPA